MGIVFIISLLSWFPLYIFAGNFAYKMKPKTKIAVEIITGISLFLFCLFIIVLPISILKSII